MLQVALTEATLWKEAQLGKVSTSEYPIGNHLKQIGRLRVPRLGLEGGGTIWFFDSM